MAVVCDRKKWLNILKLVAIVLGIGLSSAGSSQSGKNSLNENFKAAFLVTWIATLFNLAIFPTYLLIHKVARMEPAISSAEFKTNLKMLYYNKKQQFSGLRFFAITMGFSLMWMAANYCFIKALDYILPTDNTAIYSSSNVFVFILSVLILRERFYYTKLFSVGVATGGVVLFTYAEGFSMNHVIGVLLSLASAVFASFYKVLYKKLIKFGSLAQVSFTMTMIGIFDAIFYWPIILVMHYTHFEFIPSVEFFPFLPILGRGSFSLIFNFLVNFGIAYVSAVLISIGSLVALPLNALFDFIVREPTFNALKLVGSLMIVFSFLILLVPNNDLSTFEDKFACNKDHKPANSTDADVQLYQEENLTELTKE